MKTVKMGIIAIVSLSILIASCRKEGCTNETAFNFSADAKKDDGTCKYDNMATIKFTQSWDGVNVTESDFGATNIKYINAKGDSLSITRLRYSISDIRFYKADGDSVTIDMYHLIDVSDAVTLTRILSEKLAPIEYTGIGFNFGFTPEDNIDGAYPDLNLATWNWPLGIGGGYHQMQMEGNFIDSIGDPIGYAFHNGSVTKDGGSSDLAVPNYIFVKLNRVISMNTDRIIEIDMQISEWYKDPNEWDLNALHTMLMPNKTAQLMMSENGLTVFKIGEIK